MENFPSIVTVSALFVKAPDKKNDKEPIFCERRQWRCYVEESQFQTPYHV